MTDRPFNLDQPIAYLITWTTYGTWLSGDPRGWHRWGDGDAKPPNELFVQMATGDMKEAEFRLSVEDRQVVEETVSRHCDIRCWNLHAVTARSNHVHVVVTARDCDPKTVRDQFKAWCTRKLKEHHLERTRFWTEGASCRYINQDNDLNAAIIYVNESQDRKGRNGAS